jgi:hypothetical protein
MRSNSFVEVSGCLGLLTKLRCRSANKWVELFVIALYTVTQCLLDFSTRSVFCLCMIVPLLPLRDLIVRNYTLIINRIMVLTWV